MSEVNWGAFAAQSNAFWERLDRNSRENFSRIAENAQRRRIAEAIAALGGPDRQRALQQIYSLNPQLGMQMEDQLYQRDERQRATTSRNALAEALLGGNGAPVVPSSGPMAPATVTPAASDGSVRGGDVAQSAMGNAPPAGEAGMQRDRLASLPDVAQSPQPPAQVLQPAQQREWQQYIGKVAAWADTPEKWDQAVDYFVQSGFPNAAELRGGFSPQLRQQFMAQGGYSDAEQRAIHADPEAFLTFQGKRLDLTKKQFGQYRDLNNMGMQLLGGVHDQATYDAAKQRALQLYSSFGHDASEFIGGLPPQYSPETIKMLRLQGMDTAKQLAAIARENNIESQIEVREQRADEYERHNRAIESNVRRGQDRRPGGRGTKSPTPSAVIGRIMDKQARGERLSGAERQVLEEYRAGKGGKRSGGDLIGQVYQRGGKRIQYSKKAGGYVDLATGEPVK